MKPLWIAVLLASLATNSFMGYKMLSDGSKPQSRQTNGEMLVMRTAGGLLEVSTMTAEERFDSTTNHTILGVSIGKTVAQIRVPAVYRYHIPLAKDWTFRSTDESLVVIAPPVMPSLPVAIDTGKLEGLSSGIWSPLTGTSALGTLQKSIAASLGDKAATPQLILLQRESARKTVAEFVQKWVIDQPRWKGKKQPVVFVFFADEPLGVKAVPLLSAQH